MGARWTGQILKPVTSTTVGVGSLEQSGGTPRRLKLLEFLCGSDAATLGTSSFRWEVQRSTSAATGTSVSPNVLDGHIFGGSESGTSALIKSSLTANGTLTSGAIMLTIAIAEQATFRWVANPGYEIVIPSSANNGLHFMTPVCGNTPSAAAQVTFEDV